MQFSLAVEFPLQMLKSNESNEAVTATPTASTSTVTTTASVRLFKYFSRTCFAVDS